MISTESRQAEEVQLPAVGFTRLTTILTLIPVSPSSWWQGVKDGRYPPAVKLGPRTTAWRVEDIRALIEDPDRGFGADRAVKS